VLMKKRIAIIGGGIIGMYLAWRLSEKGEEVVLFEKKEKEVADFKCCSGLVSERIKDFISIDEEMIKNRITHCKIVFPNKLIKLYFKPNHLALDREAVMRKLISLNESVGTDLRFGSMVSEIPDGFDKVIFCDGANSFYRTREGEKIPFKLGAQLLVSGHSEVDYVETYPIKSGFCWKIPRGDSIEYGVMAGSDYAIGELDRFLKERGVDKSEGVFHSAVIPQPVIGMESLYFGDKKNVFTCGDAMGLTKPWSGGGVIWGLTAAEILIKNIDYGERYKREVTKKFYYNIGKGYISNAMVKWLGSNIPFLLPNEVTYDNDFPDMLKSLSSLIKR